MRPGHQREISGDTVVAVPRPFRSEPPSLPERALVRPRLLERLAQRWDHRVVTVVAGAGFGKTALLVAGMAPPGRAGGRDVWLSCEPADDSAEHLTAGLTQAFDLPSGADLDAVLDAVWAQAPDQVCIVFDDVHEIPLGSPGAAVLGRLTTDLAANGHLVFASRDTIPVPLARLAASGHVVRLGEDDLVFDPEELASFAAARRVDPALLSSTGGWPALAELTVSAGADLVPDYLWEEVVADLGDDRARLLARFAAAGGGDDEVASALAGHPTTVDQIVASVPLVLRSANGWAVLHALWEPALRRLLTAGEAAEARRQAAAVHLRGGRYSAAVDLFVEAEAWEGVLEVVRDAEPFGASVNPAEFGRWLRALPPDWRGKPEARFAAALEFQGRAPADSMAMFRVAAEAFRSTGDVDGELAAISREALVRWQANDLVGLLGLYARVGELAGTGSSRGEQLRAVGTAAIGHLQGDSATVLSTLADRTEETENVWLPVICWLRSVAHRRNGDLGPAHRELDRLAPGRPDPQREIARLRTEWLEGHVDRVAAGLGEFYAHYIEFDDRYLAKETGLETAAKAAWLGDGNTARQLLAAVRPLVPEISNVVTHVLQTIATAALAVADGDENGAAAVLRDEVLQGAAALGSPQSWYWRDRAAVALVHVLVPESRPAWACEALGAAHLPGLALAEALEAARDGDLGPVRALHWPEAGVVRTHLPVRWAVELAAAGVAARNPPPDDLLRAVGEHARPELRTIASRRGGGPVALAAKRLAKELPAPPPYRLRIDVLGRLQLRRDDDDVDHPDLRRQRVRELLCYLVARRRARREAIADELWPDLADPAHNLSVTLSYLRRLLHPERASGERPYFLDAIGSWLELRADAHLEVDAWTLEARLDEADAAERTGAVARALTAYGAALPLWRGEPFADVPYAPWAEPERVRLRTRYVIAATRAGELSLAARKTDDARHAADCAITADPTSEPAYRLLARAHIASDNLPGARNALERCRSALHELDVEPDRATAELLVSLSP
jgi:DNA-binding SARP family transcriptional activator